MYSCIKKSYLPMRSVRSLSLTLKKSRTHFLDHSTNFHAFSTTFRYSYLAGPLGQLKIFCEFPSCYQYIQSNLIHRNQTFINDRYASAALTSNTSTLSATLPRYIQCELVKRGSSVCLSGNINLIINVHEQVSMHRGAKIGSKIQFFHHQCHKKKSFFFFHNLSVMANDPVFFVGDTLFLGGCGRFFEGTAPEMHRALVEILGSLPDNTVSSGYVFGLNSLT
ncbi:unnamed protein product, partial [Meganyctiphanes norvegica]